MALTKISGDLVKVGTGLSVGVVTATTVQVGSATTIHTTGIDLGSGNITSHNINSTGIVTAASLSVTNDATVGGALTITGNLTVNGTTTTIDTAVTAVDSLAIDGDASVGGALTATGNITANAFYGDGSNLTGIDATQIVTGNTSVQTVDTGSDGHVKVNTEGSERLRISSTGLVGIGTDNPSGKLNIVGSDNQLLNLIQDSGDLAIRLNDRGVGSAYIKVPDNTLGSLTFETGGSERLRITSGGNVRVPDSGKFTCGSSDDMQIYHTGSAALIDNNTGNLTIDTANDFYLRVSNGSQQSILAETNGTVRLSYNGSAKFETTSGGINITGIATATAVRASSVSVTGGTTAQRPTDAVTGTIRYNTVFGYLEYFDGTHWLEINASGYRGVFGGGSVWPGGSPFTAPASGTIDYLTIAALGDAIDFGDLTVTTNRSSAVASSTRGVFGATAFSNNILDYITISTTGNALDFGDDIANPLCGATCNETRGLWGGGYIHNSIRYITIASTGNATDFGDLLERKWATMDGSVASPTRGIFAGGSAFSPTKTNRIEYVTISSTGNSTNFGDLIQNSAGQGSCSSSTRGVFAVQNGNIDYITIASTGNSVDFGGGSTNFTNGSAASNNIRGVFAGGYIHNSMYHITIATTGDAVDFGDLTTLNRWVIAGCSNGHGGLQ